MSGRRPGILYGGDYNPEQWPEHVWHEDVRLMREARVSMVNVGVFAWSRLQPRPGAWDFGWLDRVLDLLHASEIAVDLATATATPPPWFSLRYPDSLPVDERGTRLSIGSRQHVCPSSRDFAEAATELVARLAERYGSHPALAMWHVGNEYGDHVEQCFCDRSAEHFRSWLEVQYGSVEALNGAWNTDVWSGRYSEWDEVMPPRATPGPLRPSLKLDYRRFSSDALLECFERERDILHRLSPGVPVTTNFMRPNAGLDHWRLARAQDVISCDIYPDPLDPDADMEAAFTHDLMRSLGDGQPWLVMEQAPSAVDWRPLNLPVDPAVVRRRSLQAVGAGADGIMFFQWRGSRSGPEMLHSSMLPPGGEVAPGWTNTVRLGTDLEHLAELAGTRCAPADIALLVDWESWWALEFEGHPSDRMRFRDLALAMYRPLRSASLGVDMRHPEDDLSSYRAAIVPNLFLSSDASVLNLTQYVERGGVVVVGPFSGIVRPNYERGHGGHPTQLRELLGINVQEWWPVSHGDVGIAFADGTRHRATLWREAIEIDSAEVVASFEDLPLGGVPAVTRCAKGEGHAWYLGTLPDGLAMKHVLGLALAQAGVSGPPGIPPGVELLKRKSDDVTYVFVVNCGEEAVTVDLEGAAYVDLLTSKQVVGVLPMERQGVAVLRATNTNGA